MRRFPRPTTSPASCGAHKGRPVRLLVGDLNVRVIDSNGELIRELTLDPSRVYQPLARA